MKTLDSVRFKDVRTQIRNAGSHNEAEDVLTRLSPSYVAQLGASIAEKHGERADAVGEFVYEQDGILISYDINLSIVTICRGRCGLVNTTENKVFEMILESNTVECFQPMDIWNILNLLEEIEETGGISI